MWKCSYVKEKKEESTLERSVTANVVIGTDKWEWKEKRGIATKVLGKQGILWEGGRLVEVAAS